MKIPVLLVLVFLAAAAACKTSGDLEPIVIDLSSAKTPRAASPTPTSTPTPRPTVAPPVPMSPPPDTSPAPASTPLTPAPRRNPQAERASEDRESSEPPEKVLQRLADAYNRRDLDALLAFYAPDARVYEPPDRLRDAGLEQIRRALEAQLAATSGVRLAVRERLTQGVFVVQRESAVGAESSSALVAYEVRGGKIANVWILR